MAGRPAFLEAARGAVFRGGGKRVPCLAPDERTRAVRTEVDGKGTGRGVIVAVERAADAADWAERTPLGISTTSSVSGDMPETEAGLARTTAGANGAIGPRDEDSTDDDTAATAEVAVGRDGRGARDAPSS